MRIEHDAWLSATLARPAFAVHLPSSGSRPASLRALSDHAGDHAGGFYFAKLSLLDLDAVSDLCDAGFRVVETSLSLARPMKGAPPARATTNGPAVAPYDGRWRDEVMAIAGSCFRYSRFHVDPRFERSLADHVKREWIRSYVEGRRGDCLLVAHERGEALGFAAMLVTERDAGPAAVIDLIGVRPGDQRRGVGRSLLHAAIERYAARCATIEAGTQASNVPSVRLYEWSGFRLVRSGLVLHRHGEPR